MVYSVHLLDEHCTPLVFPIQTASFECCLACAFRGSLACAARFDHQALECLHCGSRFGYPSVRSWPFSAYDLSGRVERELSTLYGPW